MANAATYNIPLKQTVQATSAAIPRGTRVTLNSSGLVAASGDDERGDYVTLQDIPADGYGQAAPIQACGSVPIILSGTAVVGDALYSAASGQVSTVSTDTVLVGKARTAGANTNLVTVQLGNPA